MYAPPSFRVPTLTAPTAVIISFLVQPHDDTLVMLLFCRCFVTPVPRCCCRLGQQCRKRSPRPRSSQRCSCCDESSHVYHHEHVPALRVIVAVRVDLHLFVCRVHCRAPVVPSLCSQAVQRASCVCWIYVRLRVVHAACGLEKRANAGVFCFIHARAYQYDLCVYASVRWYGNVGVHVLCLPACPVRGTHSVASVKTGMVLCARKLSCCGCFLFAFLPAALSVCVEPARLFLCACRKASGCTSVFRSSLLQCIPRHKL